MTKRKAIIFDMDGVLIDSEIVYLDYQYESLRHKYPWITRESLFPLVGISGADGKKYLADLIKKDPDDPLFQEELREMNSGCTVNYRDILRTEAGAVLAALKADGFQLALASSSSMDNIRTVLEQCGLTALFDCIVSGEMFRQSKPDPEIYRYTMEQLGRKPQECLIIEDSTYGILAAKRAGVTVAALTDDRFGFDQSGADIHLESLAEIPAVAMCGGRRIRAAFFDIDGTLAEEKTHYIPSGTREALRLLEEKGIRTFLSTGRHSLEIRQENLVSDLHFDGGIYINGQYCEYHGKPVSSVLISRDSLASLKTFLVQNNRSCIFFEADRMYTNLVDERIIREQERIGTLVPPVCDIDDLEDREIYQAIPFISQEEESLLLEAMPDCELFRWGEHVVDVNCKVCGKDAGMREICRAIGISPEETIAFGDAQNDLRILEAAGIGVAMGGAPDYVKDAADYVTGTVREEGIFNALAHFHLIDSVD